MKNTTLFLWIIMLLFSCNKSKWNNTPIEYAPLVNADVLGQIIDENGDPIAGAIVNLNNATSITDSMGSFQFFNTTTARYNTFIHVTKSNYFDGNRVLNIIPNEDNYTRIMLLEKKNKATFNANTGGTVQLNGGGKIIFEENAIVNKNTGQPYNGQVNVYTAWINPTDTDFNEKLPGALKGYNASNQERLLESYGMIGAELYDDNNQPLQLANGKMAELTFPIDPSLQSAAPTEIPLWYLDENTGMWKEEGVAQNQGGQYVGKVAHFSFWNCDYPQSLVNFETTITNVNGSPIMGACVKITNTANGTYRTSCTNSFGKVSGAVPKNANLLMEVIGDCEFNKFLYSKNIQASNTNINLGNTTVNIPAAISFAISGTVFNCFHEAASNAYVKMKLGKEIKFIKVSGNGNFVSNFTSCNFPVHAEITPFDNTDIQAGITQQIILQNGLNQVGSLTACGSSFSQYVKWEFYQNGVKKSNIISDVLGHFAAGLDYDSLFNNVVSAGDSFNNSGILFAFDGPQSIHGSHKLVHYGDYLDFDIDSEKSNSYINTIIPVTLTKYEQVGGYIEGSFEGLIKGKYIPSRIVKCKFRVLRVN